MANKKRTIYLIIAVLLIAIISGIYFYFHNQAGDKVIIKIDGQIYGTYNLNKNQTIDVVNGDNLNIVKISDGQVDVVYSNCANQICVESYPMSKEYPVAIVCLPHSMIVQFENSEEY